MRIKKIVYFLPFIIFPHCSFAFNSAFYCDRSDMTKILTQHHQQIDRLFAQAYLTNAKGELASAPNLKTIKLAQQYHIPVYLQLTNYMFDRNVLHAFLAKPTLQDKLISQLVDDCRKLQVSGVQLDFENIDPDDHSSFNVFVGKLSHALHQQKLQLFVAIIPPLNFSKANRYFVAREKYWSGSFDLKYLAKVADAVNLMCYDQHNTYTTPGPVAGLRWVKFVVNYALKYVPKDKLILGIPAYSNYWTLGNLRSGNMTYTIGKGDQISYTTVQKKLHQYQPALYWSEADQIHFAIYAPDNLYHYLFIEDAKAMNAMVLEAKQQHLAGIAVFRLGLEDPAFWDTLPVKNH